jgi:hypothetical protein
VAGSSARAKARRLGLIDDVSEVQERRATAAELKPRRQTVRLLGRDIPVMLAVDQAAHVPAWHRTDRAAA